MPNDATKMIRQRTPLRQRTRIKQVSAKRIAEQPERAAVRAACLARDVTCRAAHLVPAVRCSTGPLQVHETAQRSVFPGSHLRLDLCMALCSAHHRYIDTHIAEAHELGLLVHSWDVA